MTIRTSQRTIRFAHPFLLTGRDALQPAGAYLLETEESCSRNCHFRPIGG